MPEVEVEGKNPFKKTKYFDDFKLVVFVHWDGTLILNLYENVQPKANEIVLFLEINDKHNYFGSVGRIKIGSGVDTENLPFKQIYQFASNQQGAKIDNKDIKKLLTIGRFSYKQKYLTFFGEAISSPIAKLSGFTFEKIGGLFADTIPNLFEKYLYVPEHYWNPQAEGYTKPYFVSYGLELNNNMAVKANTTSGKHFITATHAMNKQIDQLQTIFDSATKLISQILPPFVQKGLQKVIVFMRHQIKEIKLFFDKSKTWLSEIIKPGFEMANAFICGLLNSISDAIKSSIELIGMACNLAASVFKIGGNFGYALSMMSELLENTFESIMKIDLLAFLKIVVTLPVKLVVGITEAFKNRPSVGEILDKLETSLPKIAYFCGYIIGFIIQVIVEALLTGGVAAAETMIAKMRLLLKNPLSTIGKGIKGAWEFGASLINEILDVLRQFFDKIRKYTILSDCKQWIDDIIIALKKELGLGEDLAELDYIGKKLDAIRLTKLKLKQWVEEIAKLGGRVRYISEDKKMIKYFAENDIGAAFAPQAIPPTIWIREGISDLEMFHESMHFEDYLRRGKTQYLRGAIAEKILPFANKTIPKSDQLISSYIKEKYVLEKVLEEQALWIKKFRKGRFTDVEIKFCKDYFDDYAQKCINSGIDLSKITIKK